MYITILYVCMYITLYYTGVSLVFDYNIDDRFTNAAE